MLAYQQVNPNFPFGGQWFSKERYAIVWHKGRRWPFHVADKRLIESPRSEPDSYDPVDWSELMEKYLYWRSRYQKQGLRIRSDLIQAMAMSDG